MRFSLALASATLAALGSLYVLSYRYRAEESNKAVGIAVEASVIDEMAALEGRELQDAFAELQAAGVTHAVMTEETVGGVVEGIKTTLLPEGYSGFTVLPPDTTEDRERINKGLKRRLAGEIPYSFGAWGRLDSKWLSVSAGLNPKRARAATGAGLEIIARHVNPSGVTDEYVSDLIAESAALGATGFLPAGEELLGRSDSVDALRNAIGEHQMLYLTPEFVKIDGDAAMAGQMKNHTVRLHSAQIAELRKMSARAGVERYIKAFRERNQRMLLVRPPDSSAGLEEMAAFVSDIKEGIEEVGGEVKSPRAFDAPTPPTWAWPLISLLSIPLLAFVAHAFFSKGHWGWILGAAGGLASALPQFHGPGLLLMALAFPVAGYVWLEQQEKISPWLSFALFSALSFAGGLVVAAGMTGLGYMLQLSQFTGVKAASFLPILIAGFLMLRRFGDVKQAAQEPIRWGTALLGIAVAGVLGYMLMRTGNEGAQVSGIELQVRSLLDQLLPVRPRTKEFLIGHPAMILGLSLAALDRKRFAPICVALLAFGAIGQASIVNTFSHGHSPVALAALRVAIGLGLGAVVGGITALAVKALIGRAAKGAEGD